MPKYTGKLAMVALVLVVFGIFVYFDLGQYLTLDNIKSRQQEVVQLYQQSPVLFGLVFFVLYVIMAALSIPGAAIMTLIAGSIFGLIWGSIIVSFASTIGATLAFLIARYLLRDAIQTKYHDKLQAINHGVEQDGGYYLFTLRLVPAFPFFIINLLMGITTIPLTVYYLISQLGMLPATIIYVNAGKQLASIDSLSGILSPQILLAFTLLGIFPIVAKKLLQFFNRKQQES